jgi:hypothetical protein
MTPFDDVLQHVGERLDLPADVRRRVLLDLAADLEGLRRAALDAGLDQAAALARALEFVDLSDECVAALARELAPPPRRWLESVSGVARSRGERLALFFVALALLQLGATFLASADLMQSAGVRSWCSLGALLVTVLVGAFCSYRYRIAGDERSAPMLRGARWAGRLCMLQVGVCVLGLFVTALEANALIGRTTASAFEADELAILPDGMRNYLLLLQGQVALVFLTGFGVLAAGLLAHRLASRARALMVTELQLQRELSGPIVFDSSIPHDETPCSS